MAGSANNIVNSPVNVLWRIEANHQFKCPADSSDSLDGTYFTLMGSHYVWFNSSVGAAADPAPAGLTAIEVAYDPDDAATVIAGLVQAAIDAVGGFSATVSSDVVDVKKDAVGEVADSADVDSGVVVTICLKGKDYDLGLLEGDIVPSFAPATLDITAHQFGVTKLSSLYLGPETIEVPTVLKETTKSQLEEVFKIWGGTFTPGAGTEVFGVGTGAIGKNMLTEAARLVLQPVNSLGSELSYNFTVMLAVPVPASLKFSGETERTLEVTWTGYPDLRLANAGTNAIIVGDSEQAGL